MSNESLRANQKDIRHRNGFIYASLLLASDINKPIFFLTSWNGSCAAFTSLEDVHFLAATSSRIITTGSLCCQCEIWDLALSYFPYQQELRRIGNWSISHFTNEALPRSIRQTKRWDELDSSEKEQLVSREGVRTLVNKSSHQVSKRKEPDRRPTSSSSSSNEKRKQINNLCLCCRNSFLKIDFTHHRQAQRI